MTGKLFSSHDWQEIATAPKDDTEVLVYTGNRFLVAYWDGERWIGTDEEPTHWSPLSAYTFVEI